MHDLYMQWLGCKGSWHTWSVRMEFQKAQQTQRTNLWDFLTKTKLEAELGEELADLIQRHVDSESRLPLAQKGKYIINSLVNLILF